MEVASVGDSRTRLGAIGDVGAPEDESESPGVSVQWLIVNWASALAAPAPTCRSAPANRSPLIEIADPAAPDSSIGAPSQTVGRRALAARNSIVAFAATETASASA